MSNLKEKEDRYALNLFAKRGIAITKGKDTRVWDDEGNEYIDCTSGHGVAGIGHANEALAKALYEQAQTLVTCTGSFYNEKRALLMEKLVKLSPDGLNKVFLCNSGAESVEAALKFARISTGKTEFIAAMRSFHGRTMGALSATFNPNYRKPFEPLVPGFSFAPYNNFEKLQEKITDKTAGIILEVIQGEGGVNPGEKEYLQKVQSLCNEKNILFIVDEVQTGFGRTGRLFACEHHNLQPDLLCLSKAMAGGYPMGAVLCSDKVKISYGQHGTTFGGNPLACAASLATIDFILSENLPQQAEEKGAYFKEQLSKHHLPRIREIRQIGLMIGIELKEKSGPFITKLQELGVLTIPAGATVIRLLPPLTISKDDLDEVVEKLVTVLSE
jgi:acetylornithine/LysW-gamma-L-lysine aminotransferase